MEIMLGPLKVSHEVIVAELQPDAILGMDFLSQHECKVDIPAQRLIINSLVNLWQERNVPHCCKVALKEPVIIPPESEMLILGVVQRRGSERPVNMIQGSAKFVERYGLFVCCSLVDVEKVLYQFASRIPSLSLCSSIKEPWLDWQYQWIYVSLAGHQITASVT